MTKIYRRSALLLILVLLPAMAVAQQQVSLTILHSNDTHGHLLPFSYPSMVPAGSELAGLRMRTNIGGIARRATVVKRLRQELESRGTAVWLVDAGDFSDGTPFSTEYHGEADVEAMNAAGYDFGTLGNHEFNNPVSILRRIIGLMKFTVLSANITDRSTGKPLVQESVIRQVGPVKIGLFGLITHEASSYPAGKEGLNVAGEIDTARRMAASLRHDAGIVIALSHAGENVDEQIAAAVPDIDVIVGGHSHSRLPVGELIWRSDQLRVGDVNGTIIVQSHQWGGELGRLDLLFDKDPGGEWHIERYRAQLIPITQDIPEDKEVAAVVERYWKPVSARYDEIIGRAAADFSDRGDDLAQYNLFCDAVREATKTEIEFENMGGVRAPLLKGDVTRGAIIDMDPFNNTVMTFKVTGARLKDILRRNRPAVSGLSYHMEGGDISELTVAGRPVKDNREYTASTNSYFAGMALKGINVTDTGRPRQDVVIDYIRKKGTVHPVYDGRRVIID
jgi:5'-nucleotidase / UDP-sugar diphosphatase